MNELIKLVRRYRKARTDFVNAGKVIDYVWSWEGAIVKALTEHTGYDVKYGRETAGYIIERFVFYSGWMTKSFDRHNADLQAARDEHSAVLKELSKYKVWKILDLLIFKKERRNDLSNCMRWQGLVHWYEQPAFVEMFRRPDVLQTIHSRKNLDLWPENLGKLTS